MKSRTESVSGNFIGVDIGGTFTDVVLTTESGRVHVEKIPTTADDPVEAVTTGIRQALATTGTSGTEVGRVVHATTLATNLILEQGGARVAFAITEGFEDLIRIPRGSGATAERAPSLVAYTQPESLVSPAMTMGVRERLDANGDELIPFDDAAARRAAKRVLRLNPDAIAVCFLHSYVNDENERRLEAACRALAPHIPVYLSSAVSPTMREYGRAVTTVIAASVGPAMAAYLGRLETAVRSLGIACPVHVMESSGGVVPLDQAPARAVHTIESGPAAGIISALLLNERPGTSQPQDLLSFDMGGTTAKCGVARSGVAMRSNELYVGGRASSGGRRAGGHPVRVPVIDLAEVGIGGGSLAWIDQAGALHVGPESAGARPGPVCYGRGGTEPTVTDANLVLGYANAARLPGPDPESAHRLAHDAIRTKVAEALDLTVREAASAMYQLVTANMAAAVRMNTIERGLDPREFLLVSFGGCGPIHAAELARTFGIPEVVVPAHAAVRSALGLLGTDLTNEQAITCMTALGDHADIDRLSDTFATLEDRAWRQLGLGAEGDRSSQEFRWTRLADVRYVGQAHQLQVELPGGPLDDAVLQQLASNFYAKHRELYGVGEPGSTEIVTCRIRLEQQVARWTGGTPQFSATQGRGGTPDPVAERTVWFDGFGEIPLPVHSWSSLTPEHRLPGPAVIDAHDTTVVVPPGFVALIDQWGDVRLRHDS